MRHVVELQADVLFAAEASLDQLGAGAQPLEHLRIGARIVAMTRQKLV
ncbi:MAG: hypothetical protein QM756_13445 [Polyangiaceae bacterium]